MAARRSGRGKAAKNGGEGAGPLGFEAKLWEAADALRNNMGAAEYKHVVLGLIFLRCICDLVYGYFLAKFASAEGKKGGQFYTPIPVVRVRYRPSSLWASRR